MVNRVNAAFDDMKGAENTGGTENSRGLEHMSTAENTGESLMRSLLPPDICVAETTGDFGHLRDAEREYFASAVPKRVHEATTARSCARLALKQLYLREPEPTEPPTEPVFVPCADGSPAWPAGVVGSMTHCAGYRAAAVGSAHRYAGIGIDVEPAVPLSAAVQELIVRDEEKRFAFGVHSKVLFSAKEAALKTWYPLGFRGFDVSDISVACDVESAAERRGEDARGTFTARIPTMPDAPVLPGGWAIEGGFVVTAASLSLSNLPASR